MIPLVVATCNIRNGRALDGRNSWPWRRRALVEVLRAIDADVLGLQEVYGWQLAYLLAHLPGTSAVGEGRGGGRRGEACPLVHRVGRLRLDAHRTRWFGDRPDRPSRLPGATFPRIASIASYTDLAADRSFTIVDTHLDERHPGLRVRSVAQLVTWLPHDSPTIVLGDLNTDADEVLGPLVASGLRPALGADQPGTAHGFEGGEGGSRLDHVFVSRHFVVRDAEVVLRRPRGRLPSDHWPVRVELDWTSA